MLIIYSFMIQIRGPLEQLELLNVVVVHLKCLKLYRLILTEFYFFNPSRQVVLYQRSIILHIAFGGICLLAVVYLLRVEFRPVVEKILDLLSGFIRKFVRSGRPDSIFNPLLLTERIHLFLYGSKKK